MDKVTHKQAAEALDSLDDYARMDVGVNAMGPRGVLERYIAQQQATVAPVAKVTDGTTFGPGLAFLSGKDFPKPGTLLYAAPSTPAVNAGHVKPWEERITAVFPCKTDEAEAMQAEITELRALLAQANVSYVRELHAEINLLKSKISELETDIAQYERAPSQLAPAVYTITIHKLNGGDRWDATARIYEETGARDYPRIVVRKTPESALSAMLVEIGERTPVLDLLPTQKLSERIRPNSEAAPWIIGEVKKLERQNTDLLHSLCVVAGCFEAAEVEGLSQVLQETKDARLKDLVLRRLMYAQFAAVDAIGVQGRYWRTHEQQE